MSTELINNWDDAPESSETQEIDKILESTRFNIFSPPPDPEPVLCLNGKTIATPGNIVVISGAAKSAKSAFLGAAIGAMLKQSGEQTGDCLGLTGSNPKGLAIIHFDTEQSPADHHRTILRAIKGAGYEDPT